MGCLRPPRTTPVFVDFGVIHHGHQGHRTVVDAAHQGPDGRRHAIRGVRCIDPTVAAPVPRIPSVAHHIDQVRSEQLVDGPECHRPVRVNGGVRFHFLVPLGILPVENVDRDVPLQEPNHRLDLFQDDKHSRLHHRNRVRPGFVLRSLLEVALKGKEDEGQPATRHAVVAGG